MSPLPELVGNQPLASDSVTSSEGFAQAWGTASSGRIGRSFRAIFALTPTIRVHTNHLLFVGRAGCEKSYRLS